MIAPAERPSQELEAQPGIEAPHDSEEPKAAAVSLGGAVRALPWWMISVTVHAILVFLSMLIVVGGGSSGETIEIVEAQSLLPQRRRQPERIDRVTDRRSPQVNLERRSDQTFYTPENLQVSETAQAETENEVVGEHSARGHQDAVSSIPAEGSGAIGFFGVGGGGRAGAFGWRTGGGRRRRALASGGSRASEATVDIGLEWLARHQEREGFWDASKHGSRRMHERQDYVDEAVTGLAALAFLGAGHTERHGRYKKNVQRAVKWMRSIQKEDGFLGQRQGAVQGGYKHPMMGIALAEAYGMARVHETGEAAQEAVNYSTLKHQHRTKDGEYSAWRYSPNQDPDTSVTGWFVMQIKSARVAGLKVPGHAFMGAMNWLNKVQPIHGIGYADLGKAVYRPIGKDGQAMRPAPRVTAIAALCRQFLGIKPNHPVLVGAARYLMQNPPTISARVTDFYYVYYGTLAMFQQGGGYWSKWNEWMRDPLIDLQIKDNTDDRGSWAPVGGSPGYAPYGGRVYTTAMAILSLEVYYRYLPMYR